MTNDEDLPGMLAVAKAVAEQRFPHTMDAAVWAAEFVKLHPDADEGSMIGWFANAIMAGYDTAQARASNTLSETEERKKYMLQYLSYYSDDDTIGFLRRWLHSKDAAPQVPVSVSAGRQAAATPAEVPTPADAALISPDKQRGASVEDAFEMTLGALEGMILRTATHPSEAERHAADVEKLLRDLLTFDRSKRDSESFGDVDERLPAKVAAQLQQDMFAHPSAGPIPVQASTVMLAIQELRRLQTACDKHSESDILQERTLSRNGGSDRRTGARVGRGWRARLRMELTPPKVREIAAGIVDRHGQNLLAALNENYNPAGIVAMLELFYEALRTALPEAKELTKVRTEPASTTLSPQREWIMENIDLSAVPTSDLIEMMAACSMSDDESDKWFRKLCRDEIARRKPASPPQHGMGQEKP